MSGFASENFPDLVGQTVAVERRSRLDGPEGDLTASIVEMAAGLRNLTEATRSYARRALSVDNNPAEIRAAVLDQVATFDPEGAYDLASTAGAALDDVLGPEAPEPQPSVGGVLLELATRRHRLAEAIRTYVRNALEIGTSPAEIRATTLARLVALDASEPVSVTDITASVKATLDEALGPESES
jgi:hypothetical protein